MNGAFSQTIEECIGFETEIALFCLWRRVSTPNEGPALSSCHAVNNPTARALYPKRYHARDNTP
jgi:hypothetical protein